MTPGGRLFHPHPPAGGIGHHNPVLQSSWPSPSQWLVQGGRRQYAARYVQVVVSLTAVSVKGLHGVTEVLSGSASCCVADSL